MACCLSCLSMNDRSRVGKKKKVAFKDFKSQRLGEILILAKGKIIESHAFECTVNKNDHDNKEPQRILRRILYKIKAVIP